MIELALGRVQYSTALLLSAIALFGCGNSGGGLGGIGGGSGGIGGGGSGGIGGGGSGGIGGDGGSGGDETFTELVVVTHGTTLRLLDVRGGAIEELSSADIPSAGLLPGHQVFGATVVPEQQRVFVGSANDCSGGAEWCHGNGRVDRFTYTQTSITYDGLAYEMNDAAFQADGIACAEGTEAETGFAGQEGSCAPTGLALSSDGSRLYVLDRAVGVVEIFTVDAASGDLSFIAEGGATSVTGVGAHPSEPYVYHGSNAYDVNGDMVVLVQEGDGGNATEVVEGTPDLLVTTLDDSMLGVFDLTDAAAPVEIDALVVGSNQVRDQAHNEALSRLVIVGLDSVRTVAFDGASLAIEDEQIGSNAVPQQNRGVALTGDNDELAVVSFFRSGGGIPIESGGVVLYTIDDATGTLTLLELAEFDGPGRVALSVIAR